jgi:uncharacterized membrane protein
VFGDPMKRLQVVILLVLIAGFYFIPYTLLYNTKGLELFTYWTLLTLVIGLLSLLVLKNTSRGG